MKEGVPEGYEAMLRMVDVTVMWQWFQCLQKARVRFERALKGSCLGLLTFLFPRMERADRSNNLNARVDRYSEIL